MNEPLPPWLSALRAAAGAELIETHISWLLLTGDFADKFKKPLVLPFLDYGSAARRRFCAEEELRLNRRFAPALYLGLRPVAGSDECGVRMRRFAEADRLDHVCARGELAPAQLAELARVVAAFHRAAAVAPAASRFGEAAQILDPARQNFTELSDLLPGAAARLARLAAWTDDEFARRAGDFAERKRSGHVRECHGDLHLGNLVLLDGRVTPFDCIEFNEDFRWIDVASEIAFTYVDLLDHGQPGLAGWLLNAWLVESGDFAAVPVLRFYAVYRALVRAKVAALREDRPAALVYLDLAERLIDPPPPVLTITHGLSGSGKSRWSGRLLLADGRASTLRLRSDVERKRLFGLAADAASGSAIGGGIYTAEANAATQEHLAARAGELLDAGWSVIVDATFLRHAERQRFAALAGSRGVSFAILARAAPVEELRQRIRRRIEKGRDPSEADLAVLERQLRIVEPLTDAERARVIDPGND